MVLSVAYPRLHSIDVNGQRSSGACSIDTRGSDR